MVLTKPEPLHTLGVLAHLRREGARAHQLLCCVNQSPRSRSVCVPSPHDCIQMAKPALSKAKPDVGEIRSLPHSEGFPSSRRPPQTLLNWRTVRQGKIVRPVRENCTPGGNWGLGWETTSVYHMPSSSDCFKLKTAYKYKHIRLCSSSAASASALSRCSLLSI